MNIKEQEENCIPIVVGVTGHRDLRPEDVPALEQAVAWELQKLRESYPNSPVRMLNSLAAGADQLCARVALQQGIELCCPLPMAREAYEKDFSPEELTAFTDLAARAADVFVAPHTEPEQGSRDYLYRQAGIYVAAHSHVLLALWDGEPGTDTGCGTAEAVGFMLEGNFQDGHFFHAANDGAVIHIHTPRRSKNQDFPVAVTMRENEPGSLRDVLTRTDRFNRDAKKTAQEAEPLMPAENMQSTVRKRLQSVYSAADTLSMNRQKHYLKIMGILAAFSVLLVLFYLLYDEAELNFCLIGYGVTIVLYALFYRLISGRRQHEKYLQYRSLAESLRVQVYLHALGFGESVCDDFTWTQKHDFTWVKEAVCALLIGEMEPCPVPEDVVKTFWIDGQLAYHRKACGRDAKKHRLRERITRTMLVCMVATWAVVFLLEYVFGGTMSVSIAGLTLRTWFKIFWGCLSAVTVFASGYYGKLSLERKSFDHEKMELLFAAAQKQYESAPQERKELFRQLAREELIENGNWVSYCRENTPDFSV